MTIVRDVSTETDYNIGYGPEDLVKGDLISFDGKTYRVVDREWFRREGETTFVWYLRLIVSEYEGRGLVQG